MTKTEIEAQLEVLKKHAEALDLSLFAVLQSKEALALESIVSNASWNEADDALAYACEELDEDKYGFEVVILVL